jgi:uncharacterized protein (DUF2062 family)
MAGHCFDHRLTPMVPGQQWHQAERGIRMRAYVMATGTVFGLLVLAHGARVIAEGLQVAKNPFFAFTTVLAAGLCVWAWRLLTHRS